MNRLNKGRIRQFEADQKENGTEVALYNFVWEIASDLYKEIGITRIRTEHPKPFTGRLTAMRQSGGK